MNLSKISPRLIIGILIALFFGVSLLFRVVLPYDQVFGGDLIKFTSIDAYYQMRIVDNWVHNFPNITGFDPYLIYPGGGGFGNIHFFNWFMAAVIWIIGLGSPTHDLVNVVGAYFPAVLAALTVIPVYFIGKSLFNRWVGVLAAGLVAILPGEYLGRSIIGFSDTPAIETLLTTTAMALLIAAFKTSGERRLTIDHLIHLDRSVIIRPMVFAVLAGLVLGLYLITWLGGMLLAFIITVYFILQFIINHLRRQPSEHLAIVGVVFFLFALIIFLPISNLRDLNLAIIAAVLIPAILYAISRWMSHRDLKPYYYPLGLVGLGAIFLVALYLVAPTMFGSALMKFSMVFIPGGASGATTLEMQPFLSPQGFFSTAVAWGNYTTSFFLVPGWPIPGFGLISFVIMAGLFIKRSNDRPRFLLFLIWTLVMLVATLIQRRFAYYLVVNIAVLSAFLSWQLIWWSGLRKITAVIPPPQETRARKKRPERRGWTVHHVNVVLAVIVVFVLVFLFNIIKAREVASVARFAPPDAWQDTLVWMKDNTPEPLGDPEAYYNYYPPSSQEDFKYPETAYGVVSWWDYGYWISRTAHRMPVANPSQAAAPITRVANLFLAKDEAASLKIMRELDASYIVIDHATVTSKFWAVVTWADQDLSEYTEAFRLPYQGQLIPVQLFHPEYYKNLVVRLYNFDGKAVTSVHPVVVTYEVKADAKGGRYREITKVQEFTNYNEAKNFLDSLEGSNNLLVGTNPFSSPVPLDAVEDYEMVYGSEHHISDPNAGSIPEVKVFIYRGG
ncbi:MAG TPA: oligosaccharyl transferase, archaeosortase A system-associated [Dehalococcoidales bacterium]|nr:oligosaccharyl transferase, archaeosortase A system-associated [Dehalococcoidales bacterium]